VSHVFTNDRTYRLLVLLLSSPTIRCSYVTSDRIHHSTLHKSVKDGNVLEKIKAFEMQAAAHVESTVKSSSANTSAAGHSRISSASHRTLSPSISSESHELLVRSIRDRDEQQTYEHINMTPVDASTRTDAHIIESIHDDIELEQQSQWQKTNDDDHSITAVTSMAQTRSIRDHRRMDTFRSQHRQDNAHDRCSSNRMKQTDVSSTKSSSHRHWAQDRQKATMNPIDDQRHRSTKSKSSTMKYIDTNKAACSILSDNNRVYGVPNTNQLVETTEIRHESNRCHSDDEQQYQCNTYMSMNTDHMSRNPSHVQAMSMINHRRSTRNTHQDRLLNVDDDIR
jgi:hypothetical protein